MNGKLDAHFWDAAAAVLKRIENALDQRQLDFSQAFRPKVHFPRQLLRHPGGLKLIVMRDGDFKLDALWDVGTHREPHRGGKVKGEQQDSGLDDTIMHHPPVDAQSHVRV